MSMIAAVLFSGMAADPLPLTAEAVLEAHRAKTSIGPAPCRSRNPDEIVVCARKREEIAQSIYDKVEGPRYGGERVGQMAAIAEASSRCNTQGLACTAGGLDVLAVGKFVVGGIKALLGTDD